MINPEQFARALFKGSKEEVKKLISEALDRGEKPEEIVKEGLVKAMDQIGLKFKNEEIYIPEVILAARAMHAGLDVLKPTLIETGSSRRAKVVLGTVRHDIHDIGKNLVGMMLEGGGFEVIDIGTDAPAERFVKAVKDHEAEIVGISALLTSTMVQVKVTVDAVKAAALSKQVKIIVGGAPVTEEFARQIGADGYAPEAASAVEKIRDLLGQFSNE